MTAPAPAPVRVLVVEDFDQLRDMLVRGLEQAGFVAAGAGSVREALEVRPEAYDIVVADQRLGDGLGADLFRALYDGDPGLAARFVLMTADEHDLRLPAEVPVLVKPFRIAILVDAIHRLPGRPRPPAAGS